MASFAKTKKGELVNTPARAVVVDGCLADWTTSAASIGRHEHLVVSVVVAPNTIRRGLYCCSTTPLPMQLP